MYSVFLPADLPECMDNDVVHLLHFALQSVTLGGLGPGVLPDLFPVAPGKEIGVFFVIFARTKMNIRKRNWSCGWLSR